MSRSPHQVLCELVVFPWSRDLATRASWSSTVLTASLQWTLEIMGTQKVLCVPFFLKCALSLKTWAKWALQPRQESHQTGCNGALMNPGWGSVTYWTVAAFLPHNNNDKKIAWGVCFFLSVRFVLTALNAWRHITQPNASMSSFYRHASVRISADFLNCALCLHGISLFEDDATSSPQCHCVWLPLKLNAAA